MAKSILQNKQLNDFDIPLNQDIFMRSLIRELSGLLEELVGIDEASGFISVVGQRIGAELEGHYKQALQVSKLNKQQISEVLLNLKERINGDFYIIEMNENKIVFGNNVCPFGDKVKNRPSLCMMTSNVFGSITANNNGYAKVILNKTIAQGDPACLVTVYLNASDESAQIEGKEYFQAGE